MTRQQALSAALALCGAAMAPVAQAQTQTLNCNRDFAQIGDAKYTILQKCGQPVAKDSFCSRSEDALRATSSFRQGVQPSGCDQVEEWTYTPGSGQFVTLLRFEDGRLQSIRYAGRIP